jgi:hypothetical protein
LGVRLTLAHNQIAQRRPLQINVKRIFLPQMQGLLRTMYSDAALGALA